MKIKLTSKQIKLFFPLVFSLLSFLGVFFASLLVAIPQAQGLWQRYSQLSERQQQLKSLGAKAQILERLPQEELTKDFALLSAVLPPEKDVFGVLNTVAALARKSNGTLLSYSFNPGFISTPSGGIEKVPFSLSILMPSSSLPTALSLLYTSTPFLTIPSLAGKYHANNQIEVDLRLETYVQVAPKEFGTLTSTVPSLTAAKKELIASVSTWKSLSEATIEQPISTFSAIRKNLFSF